MTNPEPSNTNSAPLVPLARARDGSQLPIPEGGVAWRVRRHTGGRPRLHLDGSKQPMQLSLSYTMADLDDILPPGSYKLDLVDRAGMPLGLTVDVEVGSPRNATTFESSDIDDAPVSLSPGTSDLRYLLEANVRSTQLAFQHNQRTLEAGLRMADTLREAVQSLADTQADWIKSLVASRGFFRNSAPPSVVAVPAPVEPEDEGDDDGDVDEPEQAPTSTTERAVDLGLGFVNMVNNVLDRFPKPSKEAGPKMSMKSVLDWRHAAAEGEASRFAAEAAEPPAAINPMQLLSSLPPQLVRKLLEVKAQLTAEEQSRLMQLLSMIPPDELPAIAASLEPMTTDEVLATVRKQLAAGGAS